MLINGRYQVIRTLGEGGFGHAYLSKDTHMPSQRQCVVKQLKPVSARAEVYQVVQQRFEREAAMLEKLGENHSQIPRLYAYFSENQQFYLVQEWIEGETLDEVIARGVLPEEQVISIVTSLLQVLDFIHSQGVIHRDIKPDNVILRAQNQQPVLIDFGAMRETMGTVFNSRNQPASSIVIGTPGYMSSEQAAGRPIPSSDLYSLGLMAIYMLTGKTPQELPCDPHSGEIIWQDLAAHLSPQLVATIDKAVQSHPRDRYSNAKDMLSALSSTAAFNLPTVSQPNESLAQSLARSTAIPLASGVNSEVKTVAVAGAYLPTTPDQAPFEADYPESASAVVADPSQISSKKSFSPWLLGGVAALLGAIAIGGGFLFSRMSGDSAVRSASGSVKYESSTDPATGKKQRSASATLSESSSEPATDEPTTEAEAESVPVESDPPPVEESEIVEDNTALTLVGQGTDQIDVYEQPSLKSGSPHYGIPGDRVVSIATTSNASGNWNLIQFESGAQGWVPSNFLTAEAPPAAQPPPEEPSPSSPQLAGSAPGQSISVFAEPSAQSNSPHYGLSGDRVTILNQAQGDDGSTWYQVQFESGAVGWVPSSAMSIP